MLPDYLSWSIVLAFSIFWLFQVRRLRNKAPATDRWLQERLQSDEPFPPVEDYTGNVSLTPIPDGPRLIMTAKMGRGVRILGGVAAAVFGGALIFVLWELKGLGEPEGLIVLCLSAVFFLVVLGGPRSRVESITLNGDGGGVQIVRHGRVIDMHIKEFSAVLMKETYYYGRGGEFLTNRWELGLVTRAGRWMPLAISANVSREEGFRNCASLAKAIAAITRLPIHVYSSRWVWSPRWTAPLPMSGARP